MATMKKRPPVRQFSFQYDSSKVPERRKSLKKQFSEDYTETTANLNNNSNNKKEIESPPNSIRVSLSAKGTKPPIKVAWSENFAKQKSLDNEPNKIVKQNLKIFLNKNQKELKDDQLSDSSYERKPKLILPLNPEITNTDNVKNVFQKHIRKITNHKSFSDRSFSPIRTENSSTIIVPLITNKTQKESKIESVETNSNSNSNLGKDFNQKRSRSASSSSSLTKKENQFRPPLLRQSSVPVKNETKPKFPTTKRRVKTAKPKLTDELVNKRNLLKRCVSVSEVETMVSLVSENEESGDEEISQEKQVEDVTPLKTSLVKENNNERNFSLRKTIKSVSFQQSTIHAIRSFSASFPERRKSMATALFLNASNVARVYQIHEKRSPINGIDDDEENVPKRRLIRTKSAPLERRSSISKEDENPRKENSENTPQNQVGCKNKDESSSSLSEGFNNCKEQECWDMYCKMNEKGVTISFDTILRGMLTPTEYRLRSKAPHTPSATVEDNCEITEN
nr:uncharacterized protein LOC111420127 [Onthophagus taurus]XP_022908810.1 uncharacterized protein LOC111420127 [Onthophagus taurus]